MPSLFAAAHSDAGIEDLVRPLHLQRTRRPLSAPPSKSLPDSILCVSFAGDNEAPTSGRIYLHPKRTKSIRRVAPQSQSLL